MGLITCNKGDIPVDMNGAMEMPAMQVPSFRMLLAVDRGVSRNLLFNIQGGLGDVICTEPVIRWALSTFKNCQISIGTYHPEVFSHLKVKEILDMKSKLPDYEKYFVLDSLHNPGGLHCEHVVQGFTQFVDYTSIAMFRCQIPVSNRNITLCPTVLEYKRVGAFTKPERDIIIHAGRTWQSRTLPKSFWDKVISHIVLEGFRPVLIGKESYGMVGNVNVDATECLDLRDKLTTMETVALLHIARVLLTNDSSPIHMAASGDAHIGFVSTVRMPDLILHFRKNGGNEFGWRMKNFSLGGLWETIDMVPNNKGDIRFDNVDEWLLKSWLPDPGEFAQWAIQRCEGK